MPIANYNNESPLYSGTSDEDNEALEMTAPSLRILSVHLMDTAFDPWPLKLLRLSKRKFDDSFAIYAKVHCGDCQFRSDEAILDKVNKNTCPIRNLLATGGWADANFEDCLDMSTIINKSGGGK